MIITPPAKFCKVPLNAMPMANPAEASNATNELVLIPKMPMMAMMRKNVSSTDTKLIRKELSDGSILRRVITLVKAFLISLITQRPSSSTTMAATNLMPKGTR